MVFNKLRSLLSHSRLPLRISSMNPRPKVYRVRIRTAERNSMMWPFVSATTLFLATKLAVGDSDRSIFVPLTLSKEVPQPPYTRDDPVVETYTSFSQDYHLQTEVQNKLADLTVKAFEKDRDKFGKSMGCSIMWLWFQYPNAPPPKYEQSGLEITKDSIHWTSREIHPFYFYRLMVAVWPEWMFNSLKTSFRRVITTIKDEIKTATDEEAEVDSKGNKITPLLTIPHPELTGKVAFDETMGNFRQTLRRTPTGKNLPAPPKGHVRVTGIVQITGEKMLIHVDVDATFDPATCDRFTFYYMKVRYIAYATRSGRRTQKVPDTQRQAIVDSLRRPPPAVTPKEGEGLLEGAKAVIQEAARKARVESAERTSSSAGSSVVAAVRKAQNAEVSENRAQGEEAHVTPKDHAPIPPRMEKKKAGDNEALGVGAEGKDSSSDNQGPPPPPQLSDPSTKREPEREPEP